MKRFGPEVQASLEATREAGCKASIFDDEGCLLWYCEDWETAVGSMDQWQEALGLGWLEFVHPADLEMVLAWTRAGAGEVVEFRSMAADGHGWQWVVLQRWRVGLYWLAIGDRTTKERVIRPAPDTVFALGVAAAELVRGAWGGSWWAASGGSRLARPV
jgi:hypothetical protein